MFRARIFVLLFALVFIGTAVAQEAPSKPETAPEDLGQLLQQLRAQDVRLKQLEAEVARLQAGQPTKVETSAEPANGVAPVPEPVAPAVETPQESIPEAPTGIVLGPVQLHGFSDLNYGRAWFEKPPPTGERGSTNSFEVGDFDLFTNTRLSEHWSMLAELLVSSDFSNEFGAEMDRLLLTYKKNDFFKISFGKFATELGYYTTEFHRAQYFQTAVGRPIMYGDEDNNGILPTHSIGISASGAIPSGKLGLHWVGEVSNGRSSRNPDVPIQNFVDDNNGKAVNVALYARPERFNGLQAGISFYHDTFHPLGFPAVGDTILTGHVVYVGSKLEWLNEAALIRHAPKGQSTVYHDMTSYTQFSWLFGKTRPYFRYDYQNISPGDPIFGLLGRRNGPSFGFSRHLSTYVIWKVQFGRLTEEPIGTTNVFTTQLAFAF